VLGEARGDARCQRSELAAGRGPVVSVDEDVVVGTIGEERNQ